MSEQVVLHRPDIIEGDIGFHSTCSCGWKSVGQFAPQVAMAYAIHGHAVACHRLPVGESRVTA